MRYINLPVTVTNVGPGAVRVIITGGATDDRGREANSVLRDNVAWPGPHGRQPDWTSSQSPPIAPGAHATRYITFPLERTSQVATFSLSPQLLSSGRELMSPQDVTFRAQ